MSGFYENLRKLSLGDVIGIASLVSDWVFQGVFERELPRGIFIGIVAFLIFRSMRVLSALPSKMKVQEENFEAQQEKMLYSYKGKENADAWVEGEVRMRRAESRFRAGRKKMLMANGGKIALCFVLAIIICVKNPNNVWAVYRMLTEQAETAEETAQEPDLPEMAEPVPEPTETAAASGYGTQEEAEPPPKETAGESVRILKPFEFRFVLAEPERKPTLDKKVEACVLFMNQETDQPLADYIETAMEEIRKCQYAGVELWCLQDEDGNTFYTYTEAEDSFKRKVIQFQNEKYLDVWQEEAPGSAIMDAYMDGRENLNSIVIGGEKGNWELWWKLANDNQYYALEYEHQTQNGEAVLYYYISSIYCSLEALKYEMPEENRKQIYHYVVMRYKDIKDMKLEIPSLYKERIEQIYDCLLENDEVMNGGEGGTAFEADVTV